MKHFKTNILALFASVLTINTVFNIIQLSPEQNDAINKCLIAFVGFLCADGSAVSKIIIGTFRNLGKNKEEK